MMLQYSGRPFLIQSRTKQQMDQQEKVYAMDRPSPTRCTQFSSLLMYCSDQNFQNVLKCASLLRGPSESHLQVLRDYSSTSFLTGRLEL
jgi:hypothetical protein